MPTVAMKSPSSRRRDGHIIRPLRVLFIAALMSFSAAGFLGSAQLFAQRAVANNDGDGKICNRGSVPFQIAGASKLPGNGSLIGSALGIPNPTRWALMGWQTFVPGECKFPALDHVMTKPAATNHIVFAFTDATGRWGTVQIQSSGRFSHPSDVHVCVGAQGTRWDTEVEGPDPTAGCKGVVVPASVTFEINPYSGFDVALGADVRVSPLGSPGTTGVRPATAERAPTPSIQPPAVKAPMSVFQNGCNAWYADPANATYRPRRGADAYCACLTAQYRNIMTPEEEAYYAADWLRHFRYEIGQPESKDPAYPRLRPGAVACMQ